jgi:DUF4097 and DUF4098 domain-containing protein YvlB
MLMSKHKKVTIAVAAAIGVAGAAAGVALGAKGVLWNKQTKHERIAVPVHRIVVDGNAGNVEVTTGGSDVEVKRTTSWLFSKPTVRVYVSNGVLHLESHCGHGVLCATDFRVRAPTGVAVEVDTNAGDVTVKGAPGNVSAEVDAGNIDLDLARAPQRIDAESNAGDVHVAVPRGTYAVSTHTNAGDESVRGLVRYDLAAHTIRASTDAGDITVEGR